MSELLFRSKILHKSDFNIFSINLLIEIEKVEFEGSFAALVFDRGANSDVDDAAILLFPEPGFRRVDPIRRK